MSTEGPTHADLPAVVVVARALPSPSSPLLGCFELDQARALAAADVRAESLLASRDWGYQQLVAGPVRVVIDAGPPPAGQAIAASASTLAFELGPEESSARRTIPLPLPTSVSKVKKATIQGMPGYCSIRSTSLSFSL